MDTSAMITRIVEECHARKREAYQAHGIVDPVFTKPVPPITAIQQHSVEFKNFQSDLKKKARAEKYRPANARSMEYEESEEQTQINIFQDDIFVIDGLSSSSSKVEEIDVNVIPVERLWKEVKHFIQRKSIILDDRSLDKIEACVMDPEFDRKSYLKYSKTTHMLSKVGFIHKMRDDSYTFSLEEPEKRHVPIKFFKK